MNNINISKMNNIIQLLISGDQDKNIKKRIISPFIINIPKSDDTSQINYIEYGDLIKIKGFIIKKNDLYSLNDKKIIIQFGSSNYIIPFSFLSSMNTINYDNETYYIDFPHDYLLNHYIPIVYLQFGSFTLKIQDIQFLDVKLVIESTYLDIDERRLLTTNEKLYDFRCIERFELYSIGSGNQPNNVNIYESNIEAKLLCQGIIINCSKKFINKFTVISDFGDQEIIIKDYNKFLIELYGFEIGNEKNLTYFGFNLEEKFTSNNFVGCVNMSRLDNVKIIIELLENDHDKKNDLIIYSICWNHISYINGSCGFKYC